MSTVANPRTRTFRRWLWAIVLAAVVVRLIVCFELSETLAVVHPSKATDMATYQTLAREILHGDLPKVFYYQPFYYAVFLPAIYAVCGAGTWGPMLAQVTIGGATVLLVGIVGARLFGRRVGLLAAALLAVARFHVFYTPFTLVEVLHCLWIALLAAATLWAARRHAPWRWGVAGLVAGLAVLTRGNALLLVPAVLGLLAWTDRRRPARLVAAAVLFLVCLHLPQLPFIWHNSVARGHFTGPSTAMDAVLALGGTPEAPPGIPGPTYYPPTWHAWMARADAIGPDHRSVPAQMLGWLHREPLALPELKWRTFLLFWHWTELPNNINIAADGAPSLLLRPFVLLGFGVIASLALAGMLFDVRRARRSARHLFAHAMVWSLCLATVSFYVIARLRLAVVPLLCIFAAVAIERLWRAARAWREARAGAAASDSDTPEGTVERCRRRLLVRVLAVGCGVLFVYRAFPVYQETGGPAVLRLARPHGVLAELPEGGWLLYDHGPMLLGGWRFPEPGAAAVSFDKRFRPPPGLDGAAVRALRVAVVADSAGSLDAVIEHDGRVLVRQACRVVNKSEPQWLELPFPSPIPLQETELQFKVTLTPLPPARAALLVDRYRNYGRTTIHADAFADSANEAVCELRIERAPADVPRQSAKIEIDLAAIGPDGLRGPPDGKVSVSYEFAIPDKPECRAAVKAIDETLEFMPGSRGRVGAGPGQCLCIGSTARPDWRQVLDRLAALPYVERIVECFFE